MKRPRLTMVQMILMTSPVLLAACPKQPPDPVPADCKKPGQACADQPAPEGPPPIGGNTPPKT